MIRRKNPFSIVPAVLVLLPFFIVSCETTESADSGESAGARIKNIPLEDVMSESSGRLWTTVPEDGNLVFLGVADNMYHDENEEEAALQDAAMYAALYFYLDGETGFLEYRKGQFTYLDVKYRISMVPEIKERLEVIDKYQDTDGTVLMAKLTGTSAPSYGYNPVPKGRSGSEKPSWIAAIPEIPGSIVSVGVTDKRSTLKQSILAADKQALSEMLRQLSLKTKAGELEQSTDIGQVTKSATSQVAQAELKGMYILARWHSENGRYFYSLGVCPESNRR